MGIGGGDYIDTYSYTMLKSIRALDPGDEEDDEEYEDEEDDITVGTEAPANKS